MKQRVLVCGGRDYSCRAQLFSVLDSAHESNPITLLIHGAARGADQLAAAWASERGVEAQAFPADWDSLGKSAGAIRNRQMLNVGQPDIVIAFHGGRGTENMKRLARNAGVPVVTVRPPSFGAFVSKGGA